MKQNRIQKNFGIASISSKYFPELLTISKWFICFSSFLPSGTVSSGGLNEKLNDQKTGSEGDLEMGIKWACLTDKDKEKPNISENLPGMEIMKVTMKKPSIIIKFKKRLQTL